MDKPSLKIQYIDGIRLKRSLLAGANWVIQMQQHLDNINVFPVPDHDTGTNMACTLKSIAESIKEHQEPSASKTSQLIAESALLDAQGNSGAILAQFFQGLSEGIEEHKRITTDVFGNAAIKAAECARSALLEPREGTILTVISDWAHCIKSSCIDTRDFNDLLKLSLNKAAQSLAGTTEQLESLKKAHVLDAGAQGFVYMLEGIMDFIENGRIDKKLEVSSISASTVDHQFENTLEDITFRYCTECLLTGSNIDRNSISYKLQKLGNSIVMAGTTDTLRLHIHTNNPEEVINIISEHGDIQHDKVDDMHQQYRDTSEKTCKKIALVTDSTCDLPEEILQRHNIHFIPLHIHFGTRSYIDKYTMSPKQFYTRLVCSECHPKTSQPTPRDFKRMFEFLIKHYDEIISIHISSRLSGTYQAAQKAAQCAPEKITVIDSKSASIGLGIIVLQAARAIEEGSSKKDVLRRVEDAIQNLFILFTPRTIKYLIRGGRIGKIKGILGKLMNLKPIFTINKEGAIEVIKKTMGRTDIHKKTIEIIKERNAGNGNRSFIIASSNLPELAQWYAQQAQETYKPKELIIASISPVIGVHVGPDAAGIAFL